MSTLIKAALIAICALSATAATTQAQAQDESDEPGGMKTVETSTAASVEMTIEESYLAKLDTGEWSEDDVVRDFSTRKASERSKILRGWLTAAGPRKDRAATFKRLNEINDRLWRLENPRAPSASTTRSSKLEPGEGPKNSRYVGSFFAGAGAMLLYRLISGLLIGLILQGDDVAPGTLLLIALGDGAASAGVATLAGVAVADDDQFEHSSSWPFGMGVVGYALSTAGIIGAAMAGEKDVAIGIGVSQLVVVPLFVALALPSSAHYRGRTAMNADSPLQLALEPSFGEERRTPPAPATFALTLGF